MERQKTHTLLVRDSHRDVIVGRISDREFCHAIMKNQLDVNTPVEQVMKSGLICLDSSCRVERAIHLMFKHHTRHIPVFDNREIPMSLQAPFSAGDLTRGIPSSAYRGVVDIADVVFAYAEKIAKSPRCFCDTVTVQSMLDLKLRRRDPMDVYATVEGSVADLTHKMQGAEYNMGCQLITNKAGEYLGFVTESEVVTKLLACGKHPSDVAAVEIMDDLVNVLHPDMTLEAALQVMHSVKADLGWKYYPVMDDSGVFQGVLTLRDVVKQLTRDARFLTKATDAALYGSGLVSYPWIHEPEPYELQSATKDEDSMEDTDHDVFRYGRTMMV